ncbi:VRR-NUC domain-containing protein [Companilactobacillus sp.]|uniref:VRR-NUC domain-containing protein n=1 Tax=Companilactobacillus sp. TaxID=2767905 RepID=UPI0026222387|nr:VRR-NUC domain-containing protein [Companilactobacillus sp.]
MALKGKESAIQDSIRVALAQAGYIVFRTKVGKVKTADERWFDTGLPTGFPDLMGYKPSNGRIFFIEVKTPIGHRRKDQVNFANGLRDKHVIYGTVRSAEEAVAIVRNELKILEDKR